LSNTNESATISILQKILEVNKAQSNRMANTKQETKKKIKGFF